MKKVVRLNESDLIRMVKKIIKENEDKSMDEYINWDIKSVNCEGSRFGNMSSMGVDEDEDGNIRVRIRYCEGDDEELNYLKRKARREIEQTYQLPNDNEGELEEGFLSSLVNKVFKGSGRAASKEFIMNTATKGLMKMPLLQQIPIEVRNVINKLPKSIKIGTKLDDAFKKSSYDILSLEGNMARLNNEIGGAGGLEMYSRNISEIIRKPKGSVIDLKDLYTKAQFLKKEMENVKNGIPKPKSGSVLTKNKKYQEQLAKYENFLWSDMGKINRFIANLDELIKKSKFK